MTKIIIMNISIVLLSVFVLVKPGNIYGQTEPDEFVPFWKIGVNYGGSYYQGDLKEDGFLFTSSINDMKPTGGINLSRQFNYILSAQTQFIVGKLGSSNNKSGHYFESNYWELNAQALFNISNLIGKKRMDRLVEFNIPIGIGIMNYNSSLYDYDSKNEIDNTTGILQTVFSGIEIAINIDKHWVVTLASTSKLTFSDELDTVIANNNDMYNYTCIGINYKF